jgi:TatA/E family protein of Tat protein translocase
MDTTCASLAFIDGLGGPEMVLIFVIVLVLFGGQKLPEFARGLGKSIREFKKAAAGVEEEFKRALEEDERKNVTPKLTAAPAEPAPVHDEYMDHVDSPGPDAGVHSPVTDDHVTTDTDTVTTDTVAPSEAVSPDAAATPSTSTSEHSDLDPTVPLEPKILPPEKTPPATPPPPSSSPKSSTPPAGGSQPENPS